MVVCPIALAVGCKKCPIVSVCPVKSIIGDYKKEEAAAPVKAASVAPRSAPRKPARKAKRSGKRGR
jgi:hypothetical protein